jgi:hypothetical protein
MLKPVFHGIEKLIFEYDIDFELTSDNTNEYVINDSDLDL